MMQTFCTMLTITALAVLIGLMSGCASPTMSDGEPGVQLLPDMQCKGKIVLSATGNLAGVMVNASNSGTLQADCGDGFELFHERQAQ